MSPLLFETDDRTGPVTVDTREPRYRLMKVTKELVLAVVLGQIPGNCLVKGLPATVEVSAVTYDFCNDCFVFRLWSKDWPSVKTGDTIPFVDVSVAAPAESDNPFYAR